MSDAFGRLSPVLQQAIVSGLGFRELRPVQLQTIDAVLSGHNCVVLAPTAGGKTEAAFFPVLSRMDTERWQPVGALYLSPIRALLNNQEERVARYAMMVGRTAFKWHGDTSEALRKSFLKNPADLLLTTPESLEAMLMSPKVDVKRLFAGLSAVIIDEVHAFAAGDRGAHLVSVLERLIRFSGRDVQRIGLSATVGNPEEILSWLRGSSSRKGVIVRPGGHAAVPQIDVDYVGSLENAAVVLDALYRGRKRLCFVDSRAQAERLAEQLTRLGSTTFVTHGSLAARERQAAEQAFQDGTNCIIVATSALELGIDVGDLDYVLQIDAPASVSSFLQRMGRTGRRPGTTPNCTFLATSPETLLRAVALVRLRESGFVEPVHPSREASHILAHQLMALTLQQHGVAEADWYAWLSGATCFAELDEEDRRALVEHMVSSEILFREGGRLSLGPDGERRYGRRNFEELYAVFSTPRLLSVRNGRIEVGAIDANFLQALWEDEQLCFLLGGKAWRAVNIEWSRGICEVVPSTTARAPRWQGSPAFLSPELCRTSRALLLENHMEKYWSKRAISVLERQRREHPFIQSGGLPLVSQGQDAVWWTFAGGRANLLLGRMLEQELGGHCTVQNEKITLKEGSGKSISTLREAIFNLARAGRPTVEDACMMAINSAGKTRLSKFEPCLPPPLLSRFLRRELTDEQAAREAILEAIAPPKPVQRSE